MTVNKVAEVSAQYLTEQDANAVPASYKQTEVGVIPEDWDCSSFDYVCSTIGDGIHSTPKYNDSGEYFFINGNNLIDGKITTFDETKKTDSLEFYKHKKPLNERTILLSINGTIGNIAFYNGEKIVLGKSAAYLNIKSTVEKSYIYYCLDSEKTLQAFYDGLTGSTIKNLGLGAIRATKIPLPPIIEQTAIANALSDVDALISSLEKLIAKKQAIKTATMQQLLTGRTRLPQFALRADGTPTNSSGTNLDAVTGGPKGEGQDGLRKGTKPTELGEIPEDWEVVNVGDLGQVDPENLGSTTSPDYEFNYVSLEQIEKGVLVGTARTIFRNAPSRARRVLKKGDILVSTVRPNLMSHYFVQHEVNDLICSTGFSVIRFFEEKLCPGYLYQHLFSSVINNQIEMLISGSNYPAINSGDVKQLKVQIGSVEEQTAIATILSDMDAEIQSLEQRLGKTRQIKQGMMQELLTGKTRLVQPQEP